MPSNRSADQVRERSQLKSLYESNLPGYKTALSSLYQAIRSLLENAGFSPTIKYRVKKFDAYYTKLRRLRSRRKLSETGITDLFGLRIICPFLEDIETIEGLLSDNFRIAEMERKGGQHSFREFGYDSVHLLIKLPHAGGILPPGVSATCEIQLRTILQDAWAEVEHELVYKSDITLPNESIRRKLAALNATLALSDLIFQEIRDFQKALRQQGDRRRASLVNNLSLNDVISLSLTSEAMPTDQAIKSSPVTRAGRLEKSMLQALDAHSNQDYRQAIAIYDQLLGMRLKRPIRSLVYNHRGMAWFALGEYRKSLHDFNKAISFDREYSRGYINRGLCRRMLKQPDQAIEDFTRALQIDPNRPEAWLGRAQTYHELRMTKPARNDCAQAIKIDPDYQPARDLQKLILTDPE